MLMKGLLASVRTYVSSASISPPQSLRVLTQVAHMHVTPVPSHYCSTAVARAAARAAKRGTDTSSEPQPKVVCMHILFMFCIMFSIQVYGCLRGIRVNPWKLNLVARQVPVPLHYLFTA